MPLEPRQLSRPRDARAARRPDRRHRCGRRREYARPRRSQRRLAFRTLLVVPLLREGERDRRDRRGSAPSRAFLRQADRAAPDLRRPGGDRDRERAPVQRDQGGARAADARPPRCCASSRSSPPTCSRCSTRSLERAARCSARRRRRCLAARRRLLRTWRLRTASRRRAPCDDGSSRVRSNAISRRGRSLERAVDPHRRHAMPIRTYPARHATAARSTGVRTVLVRAAAARATSRSARSASARGSAAVHRQADRAAQDLRRPGGDRDRERAAVQRDQGGARAADRDRARCCRSISQLDARPRTGARRDRRERDAAGRRRRRHRSIEYDDGAGRTCVRAPRVRRRGRRVTRSVPDAARAEAPVTGARSLTAQRRPRSADVADGREYRPRRIASAQPSATRASWPCRCCARASRRRARRRRATTPAPFADERSRCCRPSPTRR